MSSKKFFVGGSLICTLIFFFGIHPARADTTLDSYPTANGNDNCNLWFSRVACAQKFQSGTTGNLSKIRIYVKKTGSPAGTMTLKLYGQGTDPTQGSLLRTSDAATNDNFETTYSPVDFTFSPYTISTENYYYWVVEISEALGEFDYVAVQQDSSGEYANGNAWDKEAAWNSSANVDMIFYAIEGDQPPVADFSGTPLSGDAPLTVQFTDESTNTPTSWYWEFGDETTTSTQNPEHEYTYAGLYTVALGACNAQGCDTSTVPDYITVSTSTPPAGATTSTIASMKNFFDDSNYGSVITYTLGGFVFLSILSALWIITDGFRKLINS